MTQSSSPKTVRRGRVFPEKQLSPEEKARLKAEDEVFYKRCREVFDRVQPDLIEEHYDWFIIEIVPVMALLDTGFTGWLAIDNQDADSLGWVSDNEPQDMQTAQGEARFNLYEGKVVIEGEEFTVEVLGGNELVNILLGVLWLRTKRLVVDFPMGVLRLG